MSVSVADLLAGRDILEVYGTFKKSPLLEKSESPGSFVHGIALDQEGGHLSSVKQTPVG